MPDSLHFLIAFLGLATVILLVIEIWTSGIAARTAEKAVREEVRMARGESSRSNKELREEVSSGLKNVADSMVNTASGASSRSPSQATERSTFVNQEK